MNSPGSLGPAFRNNTSDFRNDITSAANDDSVPDTDIFPVQLIDIVERRVADCDPTNKYRLQSCNWRERARATYLELDATHDGQLFLGRILMRDGPPRRT